VTLINSGLSGLLAASSGNSGFLVAFEMALHRAIMEHLKIFEMPVPGYLGFPAFAFECFTMYVFVRALSSACRGMPQNLTDRGPSDRL